MRRCLHRTAQPAAFRASTFKSCQSIERSIEVDTEHDRNLAGRHVVDAVERRATVELNQARLDEQFLVAEDPPEAAAGVPTPVVVPVVIEGRREVAGRDAVVGLYAEILMTDVAATADQIRREAGGVAG